MPEDIDTDLLRQRLNGLAVMVLDEVDSTNSFAITAIRQGTLTVPALVVARRQTAGRGQRGRSWFSTDGGIAMSAVACSQASTGLPDCPGLLAAAAGVAVAKSIAAWVPSSIVQLKWPNDVWLAGRKVAGVLIESCAAGDARYFVIGIGLNVNGSFPTTGPASSLRERATFLQEFTGSLVDRSSLIVGIMEQLTAAWRLCENNPADMAEQFNVWHALHGRWVRIDTAGRQLAGWCRGLNARGELNVETAAGIVPIISGSVIH